LKNRRALLVLAPIALAAVLVPACGGGGGGGGGGGPAPSSFTVQLTVPANGAGGGTVSPTKELTIYFSGAAAAGTIPGNITVTANSVTVGSTASYVACLGAARVIPSTSWIPGEQHTVTLTASVQSATGTPLTPTTFTFTPSNVEVVRPTFLGANVIPDGSIGTTSVTLSWSAASDNATAAGSILYDIYLSTDGCFDFAEGPIMPEPLAGATSFTVSNLQSNTFYEFIVRARDAAGNDDGNATVRSAKTKVRFGNDIWNPIVNMICIECHIPGGEGRHMILSGSSDVAWNAWVNVAPGNGTSGETISLCTNAPMDLGVDFRVEPNDAPNSLVYRKISLNTGDMNLCGERMPRQRPPLSAAQIQTFFDWIQQGAPNN
jgi:hypothetical protein